MAGVTTSERLLAVPAKRQKYHRSESIGWDGGKCGSGWPPPTVGSGGNILGKRLVNIMHCRMLWVRKCAPQRRTETSILESRIIGWIRDIALTPTSETGGQLNSPDPATPAARSPLLSSILGNNIVGDRVFHRRFRPPTNTQ